MRDTSCGMTLVLISDSIILRFFTSSKSKLEAVYVFVREFPMKTTHKSKRIIVVIALGITIGFSNIPSVEAMGLNLPPTSVVRVQPNYNHTYEMKVAPTVHPRLDKVVMIAQNNMIPLIYMNGRSS